RAGRARPRAGACVAGAAAGASRPHAVDDGAQHHHPSGRAAGGRGAGLEPVGSAAAGDRRRGPAAAGPGGGADLPGAGRPVAGVVGGGVMLSLLKLVALPALVLVVGLWGFGLSGLPLTVVVMVAALPVGSNALIFSQRYETLESEATAAVVISTLGFALTAP